MDLQQLFLNSDQIKKPRIRGSSASRDTRSRSQSALKKDGTPRRTRRPSRKELLTGGFRTLQILNETPVNYPDEPYDPEEDEEERKMLEEADRQYLASKKFKFTVDPFGHHAITQSEPLTMGLQQMTLPQYTFRM